MKRAALNTEDKNLNEAVKSGHIANSQLLYEVQSGAVRQFLAANKDYFDILSPAGQVNTSCGRVEYLAQVVLGQSKAVILDYCRAWDEVAGQLALAAALVGEWAEYRLIILDKLGQPLYEKAPVYIWNALEMPTFSRSFFLTCFIEYQRLNLAKYTSLSWVELNNFDLVNFIINLLQDGNTLSKGLPELESKRLAIARPQPFFADTAAGVVVGLYLSSCIDGSGSKTIEFTDNLPIVKYQLKSGTLVFAAGQFAEHILKTPASKASFPGIVRAVISQISNPSLCVEAEYCPYLYWQDTVQDNIEPVVAEYAKSWDQGTARSSDVPPFVEAHRRLLARLNSRTGEIKVQNNRKLHLHQYWLCPLCAQFTTIDQEMDWPEKSDILALEQSLSRYTASLEGAVCNSCRAALDAKNLHYTALSCFWLWPGVELILENVRLADGRLVRGWGLVTESLSSSQDSNKSGSSRFKICQGPINEAGLYKNLQRFSSLAGQTAQWLRNIETVLSKWQSRWDDSIYPLGGVTGLRCHQLESKEQSGTAEAYFEDYDGTTYFVFPLDLQRVCWRGVGSLTTDLSKIIKVEYWVDWSAFIKYANTYFQTAFAVEKKKVKLNISGEHEQKLQICGVESYLERDLAALVVEAFYSGSYPEAALIKVCHEDLRLFSELEAVTDLADELKKRGEKIIFEAERHLYSVALKDGAQRQICFEELGKAPEGPLRHARFVFTDQPLNLWRCRCGLNAGLSVEFIESSRFSKLKYYKYEEPLTYIFNDPNIKLAAEMFERYRELDSNREKAVKAAGGKSVVALVDIDSLAKRDKKIAGTFQRSGRLLPSENESIYTEAFKEWFPRLDEVRLFNKQKIKSSYLTPVWAVRCPYHVIYLAPGSLDDHSLIKWHQLSLDKLGCNCTAYKFGGVWLIHGPNVSFAALDPRFICGLALAGKIRLDDFFKVSVAHRDVIVIGALEIEAAEHKAAWDNFCRRFRWEVSAQDFFLYERACFCNIARGRFQVESQLL